jgi:hypothetical protein
MLLILRDIREEAKKNNENLRRTNVLLVLEGGL